MALRSEYSLGHSTLNDFLFARVGDEKDGTDLTVLSALARLDLDPWTEADRLSGLTKKAATSALAAAIQSLPEGHWTESDMEAISAGLVELLPKHGSSSNKSSTVKSSPERNSGDTQPMSESRKKMIWITVGVGLVVVLFLVRLFGE